MHWSLSPILGIILVTIFYQDLTSRSVTALLFPPIALLGIFNYHLQLQSWNETFENTIYNALFLLIQYLSLKFYFILSRKKATELKIGAGDIFFLMACCCIFSPLNFILYYCLSLAFTLFCHLILKKVSAKQQQMNTIPLAGWQAVFLLFFLVVYRYSQLLFTSDYWLLNQILST